MTRLFQRVPGTPSRWRPTQSFGVFLRWAAAGSFFYTLMMHVRGLILGDVTPWIILESFFVLCIGALAILSLLSYWPDRDRSTSRSWFGRMRETHRRNEEFQQTIGSHVPGSVIVLFWLLFLNVVLSFLVRGPNLGVSAMVLIFACANLAILVWVVPGLHESETDSANNEAGPTRPAN